VKEYYINNVGALVNVKTSHIVIGSLRGVFALASDIIALNAKSELAAKQC